MYEHIEDVCESMGGCWGSCGGGDNGGYLKDLKRDSWRSVQSEEASAPE